MTAELQQVGSRELIIDERDEAKSIVMMDRLDLEQAMAELRNEVVAKFVYMAQGKRQLSYAGVKEAARLYKNIHFGATAQQMPDGSWVLSPFAHNLADNLSCTLPLPYPSFNPGNIQESIAFRANLSKSVRMALAAVLPITYIEAMISRWSEQQGGQRQPVEQARNVTPRQLRPEPQTQTQTLEQNEQLRARVEAALDGDPEAAAKLPKKVAEMTPAELQKTADWLQRRVKNTAPTERTITELAPDTKEALLSAITPLLAADVDAAGKLDKQLGDYTTEELGKLLTWLQQRAARTSA